VGIRANRRNKKERHPLPEWFALDKSIELLEQTRWIPVSERPPKDLEPVNITWVNHNPESYYADIKDKPFTATAVYFNGQWYWWSTLCTDILAEYSHNYDDIIDNAIEVTAWMPLPKSYVAESDCVRNIGDYDIPIHNAIIIPKNATNGDMIKAMFPDAEVVEVKYFDGIVSHYQVNFGKINGNQNIVNFKSDWWNAPYKENEVK